MAEAEREATPKISYFGIVYALLSSLAGIAVILTIWPGGTGQPSGLQSMSGEVRLLVIAAIGGVLGSSLRETAKFGAHESEALVSDDKLSLIIRGLVAMQVAAVLFLAIRAFLMLPTTPVTAFNPVGVLALGLLTGAAANEWIPAIAALATMRGNAALDSRLDRIASAVGASVLDNYRGQIRAQILHDGKPLAGAMNEAQAMAAPFEIDDSLLWLEPNRKYTILAWFDPGSEGEGRGEMISISGGNDVDRITFSIAVDSSAAIGFDPGRQVCSFDPKKRSDRVAFGFVAPIMEAPFTLWLRVSQKDRLSAVLAIEAVAVSASLAAAPA